nr:MAG TPA: hypothetical protein [Caudoviricetes sp.]
MLCAPTFSPPILIQICKSFAKYLRGDPAAFLKLRLLSFFGFCFLPLFLPSSFVQLRPFYKKIFYLFVDYVRF